MVEVPPKNDPSADWPEEVKQAYAHLQVPSLYDSVIANEKLSLEMRRQDRELKTIVEGVQQLSMQMGTLLKIIEDEKHYDDEDGEGFAVETTYDGVRENNQRELTDLEIELLEENHIFFKEQSQLLLMDTHDEMRELWRTTRQAVQQVLTLIPKTEGIIPHEPAWHSISEQLLQNIVDSVEKSRYQLLARLEQFDIKMIEPQIGETVNPSLHYIIDRVSGGEVGTIARVVRVGYTQDQDLLRLAEVTVYQ